MASTLGRGVVGRARLLTNHAAVTGLSGGAGDVLMFRMNIPRGVRRLSLRAHGVGAVSLLVAYERMPCASRNDHVSRRLGDVESVEVQHPPEGMYYLSLIGVTAFRDVFVLGMYC